MGIVGSINQPSYFRLYNWGQSDIAIGEFHRQAHVRCLGHAIARCWCSCDTLTGLVDSITWYFQRDNDDSGPGGKPVPRWVNGHNYLAKVCDMARSVYCQILKQDAEGLDQPPHPGPLGQRVYENISKQGWQQWLERLTTIINENGLSTADLKTIELIEQHMVGFLFGEGDLGKLPAGFSPAGQKK